MRFTYHGKSRLVEPQCYGVGAEGIELLRVDRLHGGTEREQLFDAAKISELVVLDETFQVPGPNYKRGDWPMREIYCQR